MDFYIALDVGGTNIKTGIVTENGQVFNNNIRSYEAKANESKEIIIRNLHNIIIEESKIAFKHFSHIKGLGLAFPGPFDYDKGISYIKGINKYDDIFGVDLRQELQDAITFNSHYFFTNTVNLPIKFENDASLYALGEYYGGKAQNYSKSICLCIGTGIGSAFLEAGKLVKLRQDVPQNGWIYNTPFLDSIIDDYISARGIINLAKKIVNPDYRGDVKTLADNAKSGNKKAMEVFLAFGEWFGECLSPFIEKFNPEAVILGGQIAKSFDLFGLTFLDRIEKYDLNIEISEDSSISTLKGVYGLFQMK